MEEQRRRVRSSSPAERLAAALLIPAELSRRLRPLTECQVARLLDEEVCSNMNLLAPEAAICAEAVLRLSRFTPKARWSGRKRGWTEAYGEHVLHAESALYRAGLPHLLLPFQRDRFASNVLAVPVMRDAQHALSQSGFRYSNNARSCLIDLATGDSIRIVEHKVKNVPKEN
jgi:hypothetical protein